MAVTINASIDGTTYSNITKIITGGKTVNLSGIADGSDLPVQVAEIKYGSYVAENASTSTKSLTHGCSGTPDIIVLWSDFRTVFTESNHPTNTTLVSLVWNKPGGIKDYGSVPTAYEGTNDPSNGGYSKTTGSDDGYITNVNSSTFDIQCVSNKRLGAGLTYKWIAIRLA